MSRATQQENSLARSDQSISAWSPVREFTDLRRQMDDLFSRAFGYTPLANLIPGQSGSVHPDADILETEDKVILLCTLPGYEPNQIEVEATENTITVKGERKAMFDNQRARLHRQGHMTEGSQFQVTYSVPEEIDPNKITATFKNGVLQLEAPKTERAKHKSVKVNVRST